MNQLQLPEVRVEQPPFRPIHYLGSKLRLVPAIRFAIEETEPSGTLCDLFAGSGTVALEMSKSRPVVSVDIQEYSRVLCSALLSPSVDFQELGVDITASAHGSAILERLRKAVRPLIDYEKQCISRALDGDAVPLCDFIEHGSITRFPHLGSAIGADNLLAALSSVTKRLEQDGLTKSPASLVTRHFGGVYFSFEQAIALDALLDAAHKLPEELRDGGVAPVLSTASEIVNTVGKHFAQPIRPRDSKGQPKRQLVQRVIKDRESDVSAVHRAFIERYRHPGQHSGPHKAIKDDFENFLNTFSGDIAVFYADPPYTRDHYSRFYHVLETMCLRDEPELSLTLIHAGATPKISRGYYRANRHQSPFCIKSKAPGAFSRLFSGVRRFGVPLVLSYSPFDASNGARPRLMSIDDLVALAQEHFRNVEVQSVGDFTHSKLNVQSRNAPINRNAEVLIICRP
jgi:adenine-specific DNA methylase